MDGNEGEKIIILKRERYLSLLRQNIFKLVAKSHQRTHGQIERILSTYLIEELT